MNSMSPIQNSNCFSISFAFIFLICDCSRTSRSKELISGVEEISLSQAPQGEYLNVSAVTTNSKGEIYLCDSENSRLLWFGSDGVFRSELGRRNRYSGDVRFPTALTVGKNDEIYVACLDEVLVFSSSGRLVRRFSPTIPDTSLESKQHKVIFSPRSIAVDSLGAIYLSGFWPNGCIHKFSANGNWLASFGDIFPHSDTRVQQNYSGGILLASCQRILISYLMAYRISTYSLDGIPLTNIDRADVNLAPSFDLSGSQNRYFLRSRTLGIFKIGHLFLHQYYIRGVGKFVDVYNTNTEKLTTNIPINVRIHHIDSEHYIYYTTSDRLGSTVFRGKIQGSRLVARITGSCRVPLRYPTRHIRVRGL